MCVEMPAKLFFLEQEERIDILSLAHLLKAKKNISIERPCRLM